MKRFTISILALLGIILITFPLVAGTAETNVEALSELAEYFRTQAAAMRTPLYWGMKAREDALRDLDTGIELMGIDFMGRPFYYQAHNLDAAETIQTDELWPGGNSGYNLTGSTLPSSALAIWDGGSVRSTHQEFGARVTQRDAIPSGLSNHASHVAGTLIASGVENQARGMANAASLNAWDWAGDASEMASSAASGLWVSNHSYGNVTGWHQGLLGGEDDDWYWLGDTNVNGSEDVLFGFYIPQWPGWTLTAQGWDEIALNAPYYTIVKSSGNDRNDNIPSPGDQHWIWIDGWVSSTEIRHADGGLTGYDTITDAGNAKNVLTVGSVMDIPDGWTSPGDVVMTSYSNWGPTDDGRIKPDIVGNGNGLYSSLATGDADYDWYGGTSMASPNVAGSVALLYEQYNSATGGPPLSSTIRGLLIHTADEAGPFDGPDYMFGWGLVNMRAAADLIDVDTRVVDSIRQDQITNGETKTYTFHSTGTGPFVVTLNWTDPPGPSPSYILDPPDLMLVNDLDLRVKQNANTWYPWVLHPASPASAATKADNFRDNVEKVEVASPAAGDVSIEITHKGTLASPQVFSLIYTGFDGTAVLVTDFRLEGSPGRVDLAWEAPSVDAENLRLRAEGCDQHWTVALRETLPGHFVATDLEPALATGGHFRYELEEKDEDRGWVLLRGESILLNGLPLRTELFEPWPMPLRSSANLRFNLGEAGRMRLSIFDVQGRRVKVLDEGERPAGPMALSWDLRDGKGHELSTGIYFLTLETHGEKLSRKMLILR
jgi:subtilisin family serine protease